MNNSLETKGLLVSRASHDDGGATEKEGAPGRARLNPQKGEDKILADKSPMQQAIQQSPASEVEGAYGDIKRIINNGQVIERIAAQGETKELVESLRTSRKR